MFSSRFNIMAAAAEVLLVGFTAKSAIEPLATPVTANAIIQKAVEEAATSPSRAESRDYTYRKVNVTEEFDGKGKFKQRKQRVFQVYFRSGATYVKLLEVNGRPPAEEDMKFHAETQSNVRQLLGSTGGRDNLLTPELVARYDFSLAGQTVLNGRKSYQVTFQPKNPESPVHHLVDRLLNRISGTLWIDAEEYEVARVDFQLSSEVDVFGGMIGCLRKLAYSMTRIRVADGVWLHSVSTGDFEGRKLLDSMRIKMKSESTNFRLMAASR